MKQIGKKIYYDKNTGELIYAVNERMGAVIETTAEQDRETFTALAERNENSYDVIQLEYGQYREDFVQSSSYRVDVDTKEIIFTYREVDENGGEVEVTPSKPMSVQVEELKTKTDSQEKAIAELTEVVTLSMMM